MAKQRKDLYANRAYGEVVQDAINTIEFSTIQLAVGIFQGVAIVIHRILYQPTAAAFREIVAATDSLEFAVCSSNRLAALYEVNEPSIIDYGAVIGDVGNTPAVTSPIAHDFSTLPGGGKIVAANPLYLGVMTQGFVAVAEIRVQVEFTFIELSSADYIELIQSQLAANI